MNELALLERAKKQASAGDAKKQASAGGEDEPELEKPTPSAFSNMLAKCTGDEYAIVRVAMGTLQSGIFVDYEAKDGPGLAEASVKALVKAGATLSGLQEAGYPKEILTLFEEVVTSRLTRGAANE